MWFEKAILLACFGLAGCELGVPAGEDQFYELNWVNMANQPKLKPQREDIFGTRGVDMVVPPEGTVAQGQEPYPYGKEDAELAGASLVNPLSPTPEVLAKGEYIFTNFCLVCHGATGAGDGPLTRKFPAPPSLMRQKVRDMSDARIFHTPMRGQNSMPSYAKQIEPDEIWSVVLYVRQMQAANPVAPPSAADLQALEADRIANEATRTAGKEQP